MSVSGHISIQDECGCSVVPQNSQVLGEFRLWETDISQLDYENMRRQRNSLIQSAKNIRFILVPDLTSNIAIRNKLERVVIFFLPYIHFLWCNRSHISQEISQEICPEPEKYTNLYSFLNRWIPTTNSIWFVRQCYCNDWTCFRDCSHRLK